MFDVQSSGLPQVAFPDLSTPSEWEPIEIWQIMNAVTTATTAGIVLVNAFRPDSTTWSSTHFGGLLSYILHNNYIAQAIYFGFWTYWSFTDDLNFVSSNLFIQIINGVYLIYNLGLILLFGQAIPVILKGIFSGDFQFEFSLLFFDWMVNVFSAAWYFYASWKYDNKAYEKFENL